jgi:1,4-alpha-glucan branching enzyme
MVTVKGNLVEFNFFRPQAQQVHLVGDFNQWRKEHLPMSRQSDGYWRTRLHLPSGEFLFRYCTDGEWFTDYGAFGVQDGHMGLNSVVRVEGTEKPGRPGFRVSAA